MRPFQKLVPRRHFPSAVDDNNYWVFDGIAKQKVAPSPGADLSTQIRPPYCSTIRWQIDNPIPLPGYRSRPCRRLKISKICCENFGSMPIPLSTTEKTHHPSRSSADTWTQGSSFPRYFIALLIKF